MSDIEKGVLRAILCKFIQTLETFVIIYYNHMNYGTSTTTRKQTRNY